jgi:glycosyltransferase involved in cell wall biosynthesis
MSATVLSGLSGSSRSTNQAGPSTQVKVLHVIPGVAPRYGGPSGVILAMVAALNELDGVQAEIATTDADGPGRRLKSADVPKLTFSVHMFRRTCSEQWKVSLGLKDWLRYHAGDYDLIHIHAVWSFATAAAARAADRSGVPYIVRPAGMLSNYSWNRQGWKKRLYWNLVEKRTIQHAAVFHATSDAEAEEIRAARSDARVFVIPNGVEDAAFAVPSDPTALRQHCGPNVGDLPILLFLSRLHPKKGIVDRLLLAVASMRSPCFLAIAGGEDPHAPSYEREVRQAIERLGLRQRVALLGPVASADRWAMFDGADVFVLPSHSENFGVVVGEAMARGCPVVVTDAVQSCEHVRAAGAGEVVPGDVAALATALERMISQPELRRAYGEVGRVYAQVHFRWDRIAEQIHQMYREVLDGR